MECNEFVSMMRKLYLALKEDVQDLDPADCFRSAHDDWKAICHGERTIGASEVKRCWLQLAVAAAAGLPVSA